MPDIVVITGALGAIKTATEVAKTLREIDKSVQTADLKMKIADITDALANAKLALVEVQESMLEKDREIERLALALRRQSDVVRHQDAYYEKNADGSPVGDPYCSHCFELKHTLVHINQNPKDRNQSVCPSCKNVFHWQRRQKADEQPAA